MSAVKQANRLKPGAIRDGVPVGDLIDIALKIADEQFAIETGIREALLANDDARLKLLARRLVGLE